MIRVFTLVSIFIVFNFCLPLVLLISTFSSLRNLAILCIYFLICKKLCRSSTHDNAWWSNCFEVRFNPYSAFKFDSRLKKFRHTLD